MRYILLIFSLLLYSCDNSTTEAEVIVDCCDEDAWNYNSETTEHDDSLCIFNFVFSTPSESNSFSDAEDVTITWTGGNSTTNISLSVVDSETDEEELVLSESMENTSPFEWTIALTEDFLSGDKKIYILQNLNTDDTQDADSLLSAFSSVFTIE